MIGAGDGLCESVMVVLTTAISAGHGDTVTTVPQGSIVWKGVQMLELGASQVVVGRVMLHSFPS